MFRRFLFLSLILLNFFNVSFAREDVISVGKFSDIAQKQQRQESRFSLLTKFFSRNREPLMAGVVGGLLFRAYIYLVFQKNVMSGSSFADNENDYSMLVSSDQSQSVSDSVALSAADFTFKIAS